MPTPNTLRTYDLLRRAIEQQRVQQQGDEWNSPSLVPEQSPDDDQTPQGLLGRLRALLAEQGQYRPIAATDGSPPAQPLDPNFRQLSRISPTVRSRDGIGAGNRPGDQVSSSPSPSGKGSSLDDLALSLGEAALAPGDGVFGAYSKTPGTAWMVTRPSMTPAPVGWRLGGVPFPLPGRPLPSPPSAIPMPSVPQSWEMAAKILRLYPDMMSRILSGEGDDKNRCRDRWEGEYDRCDKFRRPSTNRFLDACRARANDRLRLCLRNGGTPDPEEPAEYGWKDIPKDPVGR